MISTSSDKAMQIDAFLFQIKTKSDRLINYFLISYFITGLLLAFFYDTWTVAIGIGSLSLLAYYSSRYLLPGSNVYQYVLSGVFGVFMAQYIYQMHGLFEMHFVAFIGSAILITYQNWKLQIPIVLLVVIHHAVFGYLQFAGYNSVYFTQLDYMDLQTFIIHVFLAAVIFFICGLWAHHFKKYSERHLDQTFEMARMQEEKKQKEALYSLSENLRISHERLNEAQHIAHIGSWMWDIKNNHIHRSDEFYDIFERSRSEMNTTFESFLKCFHEDDRKALNDIVTKSLTDHEPFSYAAKITTPKNQLKAIFAQGKVVVNDDGEIQKIHGTVQDITERKNYEEALEKSNEELRKSNLELDKFVYSVSHDLRAPLLSMQGIVEMTGEETQEDLTCEHMEMLKGSISRLDNFIADILNYSRNARSEIKISVIDFKTLIGNITHDLKYMAGDAKQVEVITQINQEGTFCNDQGRLCVVLNNLISNAIRYQNPDADKPFVKIKVEATEKNVCIEVEDNGIGISPDFHQKIFDMFYRVSENSNGSGLGLYIVKETIIKLKGTIQVQSKLMSGTKFTIEIPNLFYQ
jgi:PAS domain S-box-containing protein